MSAELCPTCGRPTEDQDDGLDWRQRRWVEEYTVDGDGKAAAIRAGYSEKDAANRAHRLLQDPRIRRHLKKLQDALQEKSEWRRQDTRARLVEWAQQSEEPAASVRALLVLAKIDGMLSASENAGEPARAHRGRKAEEDSRLVCRARIPARAAAARSLDRVGRSTASRSRCSMRSRNA